MEIILQEYRGTDPHCDYKLSTFKQYVKKHVKEEFSRSNRKNQISANLEKTRKTDEKKTPKYQNQTSINDQEKQHSGLAATTTI